MRSLKDMAYFLSWTEWMALKEDNARKRAVRGALSGTHTPLPGSYAACPSTNPRAMAQAAKKGVVSSDPKKLNIKEDNSAKPDYSFDRWLKKASEFGDDVNKLVGHAKDDDDKLNKDIDDKKKQAEKNAATKLEPSDDHDESDDDDETKAKKEETWKQLRQIHKDRSQLTDKKEPSTNQKPKKA